MVSASCLVRSEVPADQCSALCYLHPLQLRPYINTCRLHWSSNLQVCCLDTTPNALLPILSRYNFFPQGVVRFARHMHACTHTRTHTHTHNTQHTPANAPPALTCSGSVSARTALVCAFSASRCDSTVLSLRASSRSLQHTEVQANALTEIW
eukprot:1158474-Pelagomonas_calceolata.AAC.1